MLKTLRELKERHDKPTPKKWRKIGKSINLLGTLIQMTVAGQQVSAGDGALFTPRQYLYFVIGLVVLQWAGTTITDFFTEDEPKQDETQPV